MSARATVAGAALGLTLVGAVFLAVFSGDAATASFALVAAVYAAVGWLIARRQPGNRIGWLLLAFGAVSALMGLAALWETVTGRFGAPGSDLVTWAQGWMWAPVVGIAAALLPLFPDGRLLSPRWRPAVWLTAAFVVLAGVGNAFHPGGIGGAANPYGIESLAGPLDTMRNVAGVSLLGAIILGVASLVTRYRRNAGIQRQQLKWFLAAAAFLPVAIIAGEMGDQRLQPVVMPLALALLGVAIGIAILRHGLYDIDRIISRTLAYGLLTVLLAGIYLGAVTALTAVTAPVTGDSPVAVAAATLLAAAAFQPLRRRIQSGVDRRFHRSRYDAALAVAAYRTRLRDDLDLETVGETLMIAAGETVKPSSTLLWLRPQGEAGR